MSGTVEELFEALTRVREAARAGLVASHRDWRVIDRWVRSQRLAHRESERDEVAQNALLSVARHVDKLEAETPEAAAKWLSVIVLHKRIDHARTIARERARLVHDETEDGRMLDAIERDDGGVIDEGVAAVLVETLEAAIVAHVEASTGVAADRMLRKLQARACMHRVLGQDVPALRAALRLEPTVTDERLYKWIERGRPLVAAAAEALAQQAEDATQRQVYEGLREAALSRRVDAGVARPARRKNEGKSE